MTTEAAGPDGARDDDFVARRVLELPGAEILLDRVNAVVFAWYGQAVALASALEAALVAYLSAAPPIAKRARRPSTARMEFLENLSKRSLGQLRDAMALYPQLRDAADNLMALNDLRIELVHCWFLDAERRRKLQTDSGRQALVDELREVVDRLGTTMAAINVNAMFLAFGSDAGTSG